MKISHDEGSLSQGVPLVGATGGVDGQLARCPEELAERLEESGYDIPASEIEAGMELHLSCPVKVGQGHREHDDREAVNGYKNIEEFLPEAAE